MKTLDLIIIIPLAWGAYKGYKKGLLMEIFGAVALFLGIMGGFSLLDEGMNILREIKLLENSRLLPLIAFLGIFAGIIYGVHLLGKLLEKAIDTTPAGALNNLGGALLGILKWAFTFSLILWMLEKANYDPPREYTQGTVAYPYLVEYSPVIMEEASKLLPFAEDLVDRIQSQLDPTLLNKLKAKTPL